MPATIEPKTSAETASARMPVSIHQKRRKLVREGGQAKEVNIWYACMLACILMKRALHLPSELAPIRVRASGRSEPHGRLPFAWQHILISSGAVAPRQQGAWRHPCPLRQ